MKKLSTWQIVLLSTGGMIGAGWLFSPYYGFHTAGVWVLFSWIIVAVMTFIIGLSFAEVSTILPIVGGVSRFMGISYNKSVAFVFLLLGWLSYVVYLPLEVQSCIQYLGYWFHDLVKINGSNATLSHYGLILAAILMILLTWFNTHFLGKVSKINSIVSIWKILIPISVAWILITFFGKYDNIYHSMAQQKFSFESILLAITASGLAFAFTGFQNGLILANSVANPRKALPYSLFTPIIVGFILYTSLSFAFIICVGDRPFAVGASAPLLGLVGLFSLHIIFVILFFDAVIAPLGTANVYTAITSRILLSLARDFLPKSRFAKLNKNFSPTFCLWTNLVIGICFLLPFPTWQQLVNFLSSVVVFAYLSGPIILIILRKDMPDIKRLYKVPFYKFIACIGFLSCSLLIYWSGFDNLVYLTITTGIIIILYSFLINRAHGLMKTFRETWFIILYVILFATISYFRKIEFIKFPYDNLMILLISCIALFVFLKAKISKDQINVNIQRYKKEINNSEIFIDG